MVTYEGTSSYVLDDKNRLAVPAKFRKEFLDQELILVKGLDQCVWLLNEETFELAREQTLGPLNTNSVAGRNARRTFMASVARVQRDAQYRFVLPANLAAYAGLNKGDDVSIIGTGDWLEIWKASTWAQVEAEGMETLRNQLENTANPTNVVPFGGGVR